MHARPAAESLLASGHTAIQLYLLQPATLYLALQCMRCFSLCLGAARTIAMCASQCQEASSRTRKPVLAGVAVVMYSSACTPICANAITCGVEADTLLSLRASLLKPQYSTAQMEVLKLATKARQATRVTAMLLQLLHELVLANFAVCAVYQYARTETCAHHSIISAQTQHQCKHTVTAVLIACRHAALSER
eukprot:18194-Heterococcus_DN1.PRE.4